MPEPGAQPTSPPLETSSSPFPFPHVLRHNGSFISAAEREILDEAKGRLILPKPERPSPEARRAMVRDALERKKAAILLLASAQSDLETHSSFMIEEKGLDETIRFHRTHFDIGDHHTAIGRFIKAVSSITVSKVRSSATKEGLTRASEQV